MLAFNLQRYEAVGWAEELLPAAKDARLAQLPHLYIAASFCSYTGRPEDAVGYAQAAAALHTDPRYEPYDSGWTNYMEAQAHVSAGRADRFLEICTDLAAQTGLSRVLGLCGLSLALPYAGRSSQAMAQDALSAATDYADPFMVAWAYYGCGLAFAVTDPVRALDTFRVGLAYSRDHRLPSWEAFTAIEAAGLEAVHGDLNEALDLFTASLDTFDRARATSNLALIFASLTVFFEGINQPEHAATIYGTRHRYPNADRPVVAASVDRLRHTLDTKTFDDCVRAGAAMNLAEAVRYAPGGVGC